MTIVLSTDDLMAAATKILPDAQAYELTSAVIGAVEQLAQALADKEGVILSGASYEPGFGGLCADFEPGSDGTVSDAIAEFDPDGEWRPAADEK